MCIRFQAENIAKNALIFKLVHTAKLYSLLKMTKFNEYHKKQTIKWIICSSFMVDAKSKTTRKSAAFKVKFLIKIFYVEVEVIDY